MFGFRYSRLTTKGRLISIATNILYRDVSNPNRNIFKLHKLAHNTFRSLAGLDKSALLECAQKVVARATPTQSKSIMADASLGIVPKIYLGKHAKRVPSQLSLAS